MERQKQFNPPQKSKQQIRYENYKKKQKQKYKENLKKPIESRTYKGVLTNIQRSAFCGIFIRFYKKGEKHCQTSRQTERDFLRKRRDSTRRTQGLKKIAASNGMLAATCRETTKKIHLRFWQRVLNFCKGQDEQRR